MADSAKAPSRTSSTIHIRVDSATMPGHAAGEAVAAANAAIAAEDLTTLPMDFQVLQRLVETETKTADQLTKVVDTFVDPLFQKDRQVLNFSQHFALFSNLKSLADSQRTLVTKLNVAVQQFTAGVIQQRQTMPPMPAAGSLTTTPTASMRDAQSGVGKGHRVASSGASNAASSGTDLSPNSSIVINNEESEITDDDDMLELLLESAVSNVFCDQAMTHFMAEHMMFTLNYSRTILPSMLTLVHDGDSGVAKGNMKPTVTSPTTSTEPAALGAFVGYVKEAMGTAQIGAAYLPEHDFLGASEVLQNRSPVEELMLHMAAALPSLRRYVHAARCLLTTGGLSQSTAEELISGFLDHVTVRLREETTLVKEAISTQYARSLTQRMDDFNAPPNDSRVLLHHGKLVKKFARGRHERLAFLFTDIFCYVEELSNGRWRVRGLVPLESTKLELQDVEDCYFQQLSNCFEFITASNKYVFFTYSDIEKREWIRSIDSAMNNLQRRKAAAANPEAHALNGSVRNPVVCGPTSRLARQRAEDEKRAAAQLRQQMALPLPGTESPSASLSHHPSMRDAGPDLTSQGSASLGSYPQVPAVTRAMARGSFDLSSWSAQTGAVAHHRVKSMDLLSAMKPEGLPTAPSGGESPVVTPSAVHARTPSDGIPPILSNQGSMIVPPRPTSPPPKTPPPAAHADPQPTPQRESTALLDDPWDEPQ